jgi:hypothetical protein
MTRSEKSFEVCSARLMKPEANTRSRWRPHRHDSSFQIEASVEIAPCNRSTIVRNRCPLYGTIVTRRPARLEDLPSLHACVDSVARGGSMRGFPANTGDARSDQGRVVDEPEGEVD